MKNILSSLSSTEKNKILEMHKQNNKKPYFLGEDSKKKINKDETIEEIERIRELFFSEHGKLDPFLNEDDENPKKPGVKNVQQKPVVNTQQKPVVNTQQKPVVNTQQKPAVNTQQKPAVNTQQKPTPTQKPAPVQKPTPTQKPTEKIPVKEPVNKPQTNLTVVDKPKPAPEVTAKPIEKRPPKPETSAKPTPTQPAKPAQPAQEKPLPDNRISRMIKNKPTDKTAKNLQTLTPGSDMDDTGINSNPTWAQTN